MLKNDTKGKNKLFMAKNPKSSVDKKVDEKLNKVKNMTFQRRLPKKNSTPRSSTSLSFL